MLSELYNMVFYSYMYINIYIICITYRYNKTADKFDPAAKTVTFTDGSVIRYNKVSISVV